MWFEEEEEEYEPPDLAKLNIRTVLHSAAESDAHHHSSPTGRPIIGSVDGLHTVYISQLPLGTQEAEVEDLFGGYGKVHSVFVYRKQEPGMKFVYGFVRFKDRLEAANSIEALNGQHFHGEKIRAQWCRKPYSRQQLSEHKDKQYISITQQPSDQDDENLWKLMEEYADLAVSCGTALDLPDMKTLLQHIEQQSGRLIPGFKEEDYDIGVDLDQLEDRYADCLLGMEHRENYDSFDEVPYMAREVHCVPAYEEAQHVGYPRHASSQSDSWTQSGAQEADRLPGNGQPGDSFHIADDSVRGRVHLQTCQPASLDSDGGDRLSDTSQERAESQPKSQEDMDTLFKVLTMGRGKARQALLLQSKSPPVGRGHPL